MQLTLDVYTTLCALLADSSGIVSPHTLKMVKDRPIREWQAKTMVSQALVYYPLKQDFLYFLPVTVYMESGYSERIRQLKLTAKWSADNNEKKQAISQLLQCGEDALPAIQEVLAITAYDEVRQACLEAISAMGRKQDQVPDSRKVVNTAKNSKKATKRRTDHTRKRKHK